MSRLCALPLLLLVTCGVMPRVHALRADADGVTFEFPLAQRDEAARQAMLYCANLGRSAVLRSAQPQSGSFTIAMYDCH